MYIFLFLFFRELDHAMLRRLEKRILVDLPNPGTQGSDVEAIPTAFDILSREKC